MNSGSWSAFQQAQELPDYDEDEDEDERLSNENKRPYMNNDKLQYIVAYEAQLLACRARLDAMVAENAARGHRGESPAYSESDFAAIEYNILSIADALRSL